MDKTNQSAVTFFIIKGISDVPNLQVPLFLLILLIYLFTLGGNLTILLLVCLDPHLHTPMYFFLVNLSIIDMSSTTTTLHKILLIFLTRNHVISYVDCLAQFYFFACFANHEMLILTAMSYDRYVAICNPLGYQAIMNQRLCILLAAVCWLLGFIEVIPYVVLLSALSCYRSNTINHFYCDAIPITQLSCSDTSALQTVFLVEGMLIVGLGPLLLTILPYIFIISTILKIRTTTGRRKVFYTCSSHLTVVGLLHTTLIYQYMKPISADSVEYNKLLSLINTAAVPLLNPLIYSLKNKDVKSAFKKQVKMEE
ncbi:olfactory receptor 5V1-like, partial [Hyperolius riggenbachi]|uniref:olfactory receptor 5V1-like n=1 Tax=Hyperolius riggenbachi TaxID=752182 RepID=UPI0035A2EC9A